METVLVVGSSSWGRPVSAGTPLSGNSAVRAKLLSRRLLHQRSVMRVSTLLEQIEKSARHELSACSSA